jgi:hypothetical protein
MKPTGVGTASGRVLYVGREPLRSPEFAAFHFWTHDRQCPGILPVLARGRHPRGHRSVQTLR